MFSRRGVPSGAGSALASSDVRLWSPFAGPPRAPAQGHPAQGEEGRRRHSSLVLSVRWGKEEGKGRPRRRPAARRPGGIAGWLGARPASWQVPGAGEPARTAGIRVSPRSHLPREAQMEDLTEAEAREAVTLVDGGSGLPRTPGGKRGARAGTTDSSTLKDPEEPIFGPIPCPPAPQAAVTWPHRRPKPPRPPPPDRRLT